MAVEYRASIDPYGFERGEDFDYNTYDEFFAKYLSVLARRAEKWKNFVSQSKNVKKGSKVKRYCRKGIPREHRGFMWMTVSGAEELREENPNLYRELLDGPKNQEILDTIKIDIPRTFPDNIHFKEVSDGKRRSLYNVLVAFAHKNPEIGYCQGLNFIAGILLLITDDEDTTFWLLDRLASKILPDYYAREMMGLLTDMEVMSELVKIKVPAVHQHLKNHNVAWPLVASKWFICLFAEVLPIETVLRIWDCLFYEGSKILFRVSVTMILLNQSKILNAGNFAEILDVFKGITHDPTVMDCHTFMQAIFKEPGSFPMALIEKLRVQCRAKMQLQQDEHNKQVKEHQKVVEEQRQQRIALQKQKQEEAERKAEEDAEEALRKQAEEAEEVAKNADVEGGDIPENDNPGSVSDKRTDELSENITSNGVGVAAAKSNAIPAAATNGDINNENSPVIPPAKSPQQQSSNGNISVEGKGAST